MTSDTPDISPWAEVRDWKDIATHLAELLGLYADIDDGTITSISNVAAAERHLRIFRRWRDFSCTAVAHFGPGSQDEATCDRAQPHGARGEHFCDEYDLEWFGGNTYWAVSNRVEHLEEGVPTPLVGEESD